MISGVHAIVFTPAPDEVRAFFREVLGLPHVDAGGGWPIFALPPAELAIHGSEGSGNGLYLMCDDLDATMAALEEQGVTVRRPPADQSWGRVTTIDLPGGTEIGLYQPRHPSPR
jgi:predicted enzyme related to lactoylglutathione lyase